jgi:midasin (ATPase involved in ribosome maturation)
MVLSGSRFSVCVVGGVRGRDMIVELVGRVMGKRVVKVVLSTMTDMADLLGSY